MFGSIFGNRKQKHKQSSKTSESGTTGSIAITNGPPIHTQIPHRDPIELIAYYESFLWYYPNCEPETKAWFVENIKSDWFLMDCGANIGYFTILFAQLAQKGHIYAFEPTSTHELLDINLMHNKISNASTHRQALGLQPGKRRDRVFRIWGNPPEEEEYDFTTIDEFAKSNELKRLDCIKIDVDSFDFEVLRGAEHTLKTFDPYVMVELNHALGQRNQSVTEALEWMAMRGYTSALVLDRDNFLFKRNPSIPRRAEALKIEVILKQSPYF